MNALLKEIERDLNQFTKDKDNVIDYSKFHKNKTKAIGIKTVLITKVANKYFQNIKHLSKKEIFVLCEQLLILNSRSERKIAFDWSFRLKKQYNKADFKIFENWLKKYCNDWGSIDAFCTHTFGDYLLQFPEDLNKIYSWAKSKDLLLRRASAVILIYSIRNKKYVKEGFKISDLLIEDKEDLVNKGQGWMLKEIGLLTKIII
jgi:3-methyladenine DNA glycosylase AlkD